jgi:hypothetical protein
MTSDNASTPDGPDRLDWDRYEAELEAQAATSARTGGGTVDPNRAMAGEGRVLVDSPAAQRPLAPGWLGCAQPSAAPSSRPGYARGTSSPRCAGGRPDLPPTPAPTT